MLNTGREDKSRLKAQGERLKGRAETLLHVAVGVVTDFDGRVLISLRSDTVHQGGLWEFPGGKVEEGESVECALARELREELGICVVSATPLIQIEHQYSDLNVLLDVYRVSSFSGVASGCEGQEVRWVHPDQLLEYSFPEANKAIVTAVQLPTDYAILNGSETAVLLTNLQLILDQGIKLIQARVKPLSSQELSVFFDAALPMCKKQGARLIVNSAVSYKERIAVDGIHLTSKDLFVLDSRPKGYGWVAASCHNLDEIKQAEKIAVDFIVVAPVLETATHPEAKSLGWDGFQELVEQATVPVFALGGMQVVDKEIAQLRGAQGLAGISLFLNSGNNKITK